MRSRSSWRWRPRRSWCGSRGRTRGRPRDSLYLLAVAVIAIRHGTLAALLAAAGAFLIYNLLFVEPRFTLAVSRPDELITLFLLLFVGVVIGRLTGAQRERQQVAALREREARALFAISRELATASPDQRDRDGAGSRPSRRGDVACWVGLGATVAGERAIGDTAPGAKRWSRSGRTPCCSGSDPRTSPPGSGSTPGPAGGGSAAAPVPGCARRRWRGDRLPLVRSERPVGPAVHRGDPVAGGDRRPGGPGGSPRRLAAAAADAEVERRSDELRSALLDSVSHDLRTPLAAIRAAAGSLADPTIELGDAERRATARAIDEEADRLNRLVGSLLDMSRIQSGALATDLEVTPLAELLDPILERYRPRLAGRLSVHLPDDLPAVRVDQVFLSQALPNVLDNAATHSSPDSSIVVGAHPVGADVEITRRGLRPGRRARRPSTCSIASTAGRRPRPRHDMASAWA